jgi:hypothetical protein
MPQLPDPPNQDPFGPFGDVLGYIFAILGIMMLVKGALIAFGSPPQ